ncbi:hypothetical protein [Actinacidiphila soli]|uniref:hypothetical protein n=1 Tax=Actinacidiphila soli TaxID=2487275 RepID=UPI000FCBDEC3|nr:hypothetical protein [Actinacidiphila soli]
MPENAARKKRARALAQSMGISYTAALRRLNARPAMARRLLGPGEAATRFGRPVGIIAQPSPPRPPLIGTEGIGDRLREIRLCYARLPHAYMLTNLPYRARSATPPRPKAGGVSRARQ